MADIAKGVEKTTGGVRLRVFFPDEGYERLRKVADVLNLDAPSLVRVCAGIGLAQMELLTGAVTVAAGSVADDVVEAAMDASVGDSLRGMLK
jgi:hypothetical protein